MRTRLLALLALLAAPPAAVGDAPGADLVGHVWPDDVTPGAPVRLYGFVQNAVDAPRTGAFNVTLHVNGTLLESQRLAGLGPGEDAWFVTGANVTLGEETHVFEVRVDALDEVPESREDNNVGTTRVRFTHQRPDLAVEVTAARVTGWPQPRVTAEYRACNLGNRTSGDAVTVTGAFHGHGVPGVTPGAIDFPPQAHAALAPLACVRGSVHVDAPHDLAGYRTVALRVDATGGEPVWERGMENNRAARNVWMGPGPEPRVP